MGAAALARVRTGFRSRWVVPWLSHPTNEPRFKLGDLREALTSGLVLRGG